MEVSTFLRPFISYVNLNSPFASYLKPDAVRTKWNLRIFLLNIILAEQRLQKHLKMQKSDNGSLF